MDRWSTVAAPNSTPSTPRLTRYEDYARDGAPGRVVQGWVDNTTGPGVGIFSSDDSYARLREYVWHPELQRPLEVHEPSALLTTGLDHIVIYDYDAPPEGANTLDTSPPNEAPTERVSRRIERGKTLDASGAVVDAVEQVTQYRHDPLGRLASIQGPATINRTEIGYDGDGSPGSGTTGFRNSVKRCLDGTCSVSLETTFSNFDPRGNPQTVTDPNGHVTTFTYDGLGRVRTATPPWPGPGSPTICFSYDVDGNLVRVDFPPDNCSVAPPHPSSLGYDTKRDPLFVADAEKNAIVWAYDRGRVERTTRYSGFVDLGSPGMIVTDEESEYDPATGRLMNPSVLSSPTSPSTRRSRSTTVRGSRRRSKTRIAGPMSFFDAIDRLSRLQQLRTVNSAPVTYETGLDYDTQSNVSQVTDPASKATAYRTDDFGRLVEVTSPDTGVTRYLYDTENNRMTKIENADGAQSASRATVYEYDGLDRLTRIDLPIDPDWIFTYDTDPPRTRRDASPA